MMKQESLPVPIPIPIPPTPTTNHQTPPTVCGQCGVEEHKLLHSVRIRSNLRRLCTTCVLRTHTQAFCPACLGVYDSLPPADAVVCDKCYSPSHRSCVIPPPSGTIASSRSQPACSACLNPGLLVLNLSRVNGGGGGRVIDVNAARLLLAAGKIAAVSMAKAEVAAGVEAERRAKEAAYTNKRAREALDHVVRLTVRERRNVGEIGGKVCNVVVPMQVQGGNVVSKVDGSSEVLKALDAVELKDNGMAVVPGVVDKSVVFESLGDGAVGMEADGNGNDLGFDSVAEIGGVKNDGLVNSAENGEEQAVEKIVVMVENNASNP